MLKKVYIEITNVCNLNCDFCIKNKRNERVMNEGSFRMILNKLKGYTKYLYFHILGEPLLHPHILKFIEIAHEEGFFTNITTNGYLIKRIDCVKNLRQLNISLHSYDEKYNIPIEKYMNSIFDVVDNLYDTYISYRLWVNNENSNQMLDMLNKHYRTSIKLENIKGKVIHKINRSYQIIIVLLFIMSVFFVFFKYNKES